MDTVDLTPMACDRLRMAEQFDQIINDIKQKYGDLDASERHCISALPKNMPAAGVYLFSENGRPLYVGRTNNLRQRLLCHTRNNHNQATFAFLLARHATGNLKASYQPQGSRQNLLAEPVFRVAFDEARQRIKTMDVQFVEEPDPIKQAILEVFVAFQTQAVFNDFNNH